MAFNWKNIVGTVAPSLATALGGPLAGLATRAIGNALLGDENASEDQVAQAIQNASPDDLLKLKKADQEFKVRMRELDIQLKEISTQDLASAREREKVVGGYTNPILAGVIVGGFLAMVGYLLGWGLPQGANAGLIGTLVGYVSAKAEQVVAYYFGSSSSSAQKNSLLLGKK